MNEAYAAACPGGLQVYIFKSLEEGDGDSPLSTFHCADVARRQEGRNMAQAPLCTASF